MKDTENTEEKRRTQKNNCRLLDGDFFASANAKTVFLGVGVGIGIGIGVEL
jgi:hypothetical protein